MAQPGLLTRKARLPEIAPAVRFRNALGRFGTGVCVVTTLDASGSRHGCTINAFTSVSLDPPLVLVSLARTTKAHDALVERAFTVNVLGAHQLDTALHFAGTPKPHAVVWSERHETWLSGCLAWFECQPWAAYDGGDHTLFLGRVEGFEARSGDALGYYEGRFVELQEQALGLEYVL